MPKLEAVVTTSIMGPVRIFPRTSGTVTEIVIEETGGAAFALPCKAVADHFNPFIAQLKALRKAA